MVVVVEIRSGSSKPNSLRFKRRCRFVDLTHKKMDKKFTKTTNVLKDNQSRIINKVQFEFGLTCTKHLDNMTNSTDTLIVQLNINVTGAMFLDIVIKQDNAKNMVQEVPEQQQ